MPGFRAANVVAARQRVGNCVNCVDSVGRVVVAVSGVSPKAVYVKRWSGSAWESLFDGVGSYERRGHGSGADPSELLKGQSRQTPFYFGPPPFSA